MVSAAFRSYLERLLDKLDIDSSVFADYIIGLLEEESDDDTTLSISQWLVDLTLTTSSKDADHYAIAEKIRRKFDSISNVNSNFIDDGTEGNDANYNDLKELKSSQHNFNPESNEWFPQESDPYSEECDYSQHEVGEGEDGYYVYEDAIDLTENEEDYTDVVALAIKAEDLLLIECPALLFSSEAIYAVLYECCGDPELAAATIVSAYNGSLSERCRPCRHMLTGKCYKHDCPFLHDVSDITCRFWLLAHGCSALSVQGKG